MKIIKALVCVFLLSLAGASVEASATTTGNTITNVAPKKKTTKKKTAKKKTAKKSSAKHACKCCGYVPGPNDYNQVSYSSEYRCYICTSCERSLR